MKRSIYIVSRQVHSNLSLIYNVMESISSYDIVHYA